MSEVEDSGIPQESNLSPMPSRMVMKTMLMKSLDLELSFSGGRKRR
jgi:hypothetical protein